MKPPMQKKIFKIVANVVENDFFGIDTKHIKQGLSSISAMKLCILISDEFGVTVKQVIFMKTTPLKNWKTMSCLHRKSDL